MKFSAGSAGLMVISAVCGLLGWGLGKVSLPQREPVGTAVPSVRAQAAASPLGRGSKVSPAAVTRAFADKKEAETDADFAKAWAVKDPRAFLTWLLQCQPQPAMEIVQAFFKTWVLRNPDAAFEAACNLPPRFKRNGLFPEMLAALLDHDLEAAFRWTDRVQEDIQFFQHPNDTWIKNPPEQLSERMAKLAPGRYAGVLVSQFTARWAQQDPAAARIWAEKLDPALRGCAMQGVLKAWAEKDPAGAMEFVKTEADSSERQAAAYEVLNALGKTDPAAALTWMAENGGLAGQAMNNIFRSWAEKDAAAVFRYVEDMENPQLRMEAIISLTRAWNAGDAGKPVLEWLKQLPPGPERAEGLNYLAYGWSVSAPEESRAYFESLPEGELTPGLLGQIVIPMASDDPAKGLAWAAGLTNGAAERAVSEMISRWKENDPQAAKQAVDEMPPGPLREAALKVFQPPDSSKP